jgi:penicillin-insensitive murein endopeptidase
MTLLLPCFAYAGSSTCYGTTANGWLENGVQLPVAGRNYVGYSSIGRLIGRTYVHSEVKEIIEQAYASLALTHPDKVFKYAETGFAQGGKFRPHKTHHNGLSVDFMVPVLTASGESVHLPTHPLNTFGYDIEFVDRGNHEGLVIDYKGLAAHIVAIHKATKAHGHDLWRVIFDPKLQPYLMKTKYSEYLKDHVEFSKKRSWVRHDEHYHIDFAIPCEPID